MLNQCQFIGHLGGDPEYRQTNGDPVANFNIGVSEKWKDRDGETREKTEWVSVVVWGKLADTADRYLRKGSKVYVQGKLQTRSWEKDGQTRYKTEVVLSGPQAILRFLDSREDAERRNRGGRDDDRGRGRDDDRRRDEPRRDDRRRDEPRREETRRAPAPEPSMDFADEEIPF